MQDIPSQIQRLEIIFDEIHDYLCESEGINSEVSIKALKGALFCRALFCDLVSENQDGVD